MTSFSQKTLTKFVLYVKKPICSDHKRQLKLFAKKENLCVKFRQFCYSNQSFSKTAFTEKKLHTLCALLLQVFVTTGLLSQEFKRLIIYIFI